MTNKAFQITSRFIVSNSSAGLAGCMYEGDVYQINGGIFSEVNCLSMTSIDSIELVRAILMKKNYNSRSMHERIFQLCMFAENMSELCLSIF